MQFREVTERYRLEKIVRSTRSGTVLRAVDSQSGQTVAVKLITVGPSPGLEEGGPKFEHLAATLAGLRHPSLPPVLDSGFTPDGSAFLVFPFYDGRNFETVAGGPPEQILPLVLQALDGLEVLAARGLAHHNITIDNLFVADGPNGPRIKLLGLGTAIFQVPDGPNARFRAPEMGLSGTGAAGSVADWRADLFSFGMTACRGLGATEALDQGDEPVVQMPFALSFELENSEGIRQVLERCLRRRPDERPSPALIREAFRPALTGGAPEWQEKTSPMIFAEPEPAPVQPVAAMPAPAPAPPVAAPPAPEVRAAAPAPVPVAPPPPMAPVATAAPVASAAVLPEPEPEGELFPAITDDILNALPEDWQPAPPKAAADPARVLPFLGKAKGAAPAVEAEGDEPSAEAVAPAAVPPPRRTAVLAGVGLILVLVIAGGLWMVLRPEPASAPAVAAPVAPAPPPPPARKPAAERLAEAQAALAAGKDFKARELIASFDAQDHAALGAQTALTELQQALATNATEHLGDDLEKGLAGSLDNLRNAVSANVALGTAAPAELQESLEKARQALALYSEAEKASQGPDPAAVLQHYGALAALIPKIDDPDGIRDRAAAAIEAEAQKLAEAGQYPAAVARLQAIQSTWPDRPGFAERLAEFEGYQRDEVTQKALLDKLASIERRRKPFDGLEAIREVKPVPSLAPRFDEIRQRLEAQLTRLDGQPPQVFLRDGYFLEYARGTVANLSFRVTDDYEVKSVKAMARPQGGKMREMTLKKNKFGYDLEIPASFHQNGTVELYVVATDLSGHEGFYGSPDSPKQLKRSSGYTRF